VTCLYLRIIANCPDALTLQRVQVAAAKDLAPWKAEEDIPVAAYWKLPNHFVLSYTINPGTDAVHRAITALEPFGWDSRTPDKDASCVWNKAADRLFIDAAVIWVELGFRESC
jgi:hypothetical protein